MDVAGVYRESCDYTGLKNHRRLLEAVGKIQRGTTDRAVVDFWLSPERIRERELEYFEWEEASYWRGYHMCLEEPECAKLVRKTFANRSADRIFDQPIGVNAVGRQSWVGWCPALWSHGESQGTPSSRFRAALSRCKGNDGRSAKLQYRPKIDDSKWLIVGR